MKYIDANQLKELLDEKYKEFTEKAKKDCPLQYQYMADGLEIAKQFVDSLQKEMWKPSEEQMKALYDACCISFEEERDFHPSLSRLYHDLMKL